jgi:hypothetical protein
MKTKKYFAYVLSLLFLIGFTTSCGEDSEEVDTLPTLTDAGSSTEITVGAKANIKASVIANSKIEKIEVLLNNATKTTKTSGFTNTTSDNFVYEYQSETADAGKTLTFSVKVTDKKGKFTSKDFAVTVKAATTDLSAEADFTWIREGGAAGTGLTAFGLSWTENTSSVAIIKKGAKKLVKLTGAQYTSITTKEGLKTAVDAAADVADIRDVSVTDANKTYTDLVIATVTNDDKYYILKINSSKVETGTAGTKVTIAGKSKN